MRPRIAGVLSAGQAAIPRVAVERLACGGGDFDIWHTGPAGLTATRGALGRDDRIAVAADAVLYQHDSLADRLGLPRDVSEPRLILAAYCRWGEDCVDHLEGDFAFAVADRDRAKLFLARDRFGVRPLYYAHGPRGFEFASRAGVLPGNAGADAPLRPPAVAAFLLGRVLDHEGTFREGIRRLPAAHCLTVTREGAVLRKYWQPRVIPLPGRTELPELFLATFRDCVHDRLRQVQRPGALLSGGLDSSSIACVARDRLGDAQQPLPTFSMVFDAPGTCNERPFVDAVTDTGGFASRVLERRDYAPLTDLEAILDEQDGPVLAPNLACMRPLLALARDAGVEVLLNGHGGDEVVSQGYGRLDDLAGSGRWITLWRECAAVADTYGERPWPTLAAISARHSRLDARIAARALRRFADVPPAGEPAHLLSRDCIGTSGIREAVRAAGTIDPAAGEQAQHLATLAAPLQPYAFEVLANAYAAMGIEGRFPFWDRRLVELCLSLPSREKLDRGWSRLILRRAMGGVIPDQVRLRRDKMDFVHLLASGLVRHHHEEIEEMLSDRTAELAGYLDLERARALYARLAADPLHAPGREVQALWRAVAMARWLRRRSRAAAASAPLARSHPMEAAR
ncbi:MAG TPA: asparagine synthase-related protein [Novosphingobium sp.]|nr:asparagine synthase-related protein [Novosphingobium sp.]